LLSSHHLLRRHSTLARHLSKTPLNPHHPCSAQILASCNAARLMVAELSCSHRLLSSLPPITLAPLMLPASPPPAQPSLAHALLQLVGSSL
jgi:hypothetical protein